jgi:K+-transporting ATPase ATPase C chain
MRISNLIRQHVAALRAMVVLTLITGAAYPAAVWAVAQLPGLHDKAEGSIVTAHGRIVGSSLIGQAFLDAKGNAIPQYFQSRPSAAGSGYDTSASGGTNLGPESIVDTPGDPANGAASNAAASGYKAGLLSQVCANSYTVAGNETVKALGPVPAQTVSGARPFCTNPGDAYGQSVGAVLTLIGPRDNRGHVVHPTRVISINEACTGTDGKQRNVAPFIATYDGVKVECANYTDNVNGVYNVGQNVPIYGDAPADPQVPPDAVTNSGSGLDPNISPAYAKLQVARVAEARDITPAQVEAAIGDNTGGRALGFMGEPTVNVLQLNVELDQKYPVKK